jgi:hypothetical protein
MAAIERVSMPTVKASYQYRDKHGHYVITAGERLIEVKIVGTIGISFARRFCADYAAAIVKLGCPAWGYFADLSESLGETIEAQAVMVDLHKHCLATGGVVDAYTAQHAFVIDQIAKSRIQGGINSDIRHHLFPSRKQALKFIHKVLEKSDLDSTFHQHLTHNQHD